MRCDTKENVTNSPTEISVTNSLDPKHGMVLLNNGKINFGAIAKREEESLFQFFSPVINSSCSDGDDKVLIRNVPAQKFVKLSPEGHALATESNAHNASAFFLEPM